MKITKLPVFFEGKSYMFETFMGLLLEKSCNEKSTTKEDFSPKVAEALSLNNNPFTLQKLQGNIKKEIPKISILTKLYVKALIRVCKVAFLIARIFTLFRLPIFENSTEAILIFRKTATKYLQSDLCLPRALFAAVTSKKFKDKGVVFIGVSLPSKSMHAWVIEEDVQPDPYDGIWINFQPVAVIW